MTDNIHIEGRRWFQRTYGNTYNSVRIYKNGEQVAHLPESYGYDEYYLQRAQDWLADNGFPELKETYKNGFRRYGGTVWLRDHGISYSAIDVSRERDL